MFLHLCSQVDFHVPRYKKLKKCILFVEVVSIPFNKQIGTFFNNNEAHYSSATSRNHIVSDGIANKTFRCPFSPKMQNAVPVRAEKIS